MKNKMLMLLLVSLLGESYAFASDAPGSLVYYKEAYNEAAATACTNSKYCEELSIVLSSKSRYQHLNGDGDLYKVSYQDVYSVHCRLDPDSKNSSFKNYGKAVRFNMLSPNVRNEWGWIRSFNSATFSTYKDPQSAIDAYCASIIQQN